MERPAFDLSAAGAPLWSMELRAQRARSAEVEMKDVTGHFVLVEQIDTEQAVGRRH